MGKKTTVVVGMSVNAEMLAIFKGNGEKVPGESLEIGLAGSSANVATAFNNFDINAVLLGLVGYEKGGDADEILNLALKKTSLTFKRLPALTESNFALWPRNTDSEKSSLIGYRGTIVPEQIERAISEIHRSNGDWRIATGVTEDQFELAKELLDNTRKGFRSLGPHKSWCMGGDKEKLIELMHYTDLFILNKEEFDNLDITTSNIHKAGVKLIVITDAEKGGMYSHRNTCYTFDAVKAAEITSFVGAGDWFHAGLLISLIDQDASIDNVSEENLQTAINFAARVAAKKIGINGGSNGPKRTDL